MRIPVGKVWGSCIVQIHTMSVVIFREALCGVTTPAKVRNKKYDALRIHYTP